jgi:serralysin
VNNPTLDNNTDALINGNRWTSSNISFSFTDSISDYETGYDSIAALQNGFQAFSTIQQSATRYWLQTNFKNVATLTFSELTGASDRDSMEFSVMTYRPYIGAPLTHYRRNVY